MLTLAGSRKLGPQIITETNKKGETSRFVRL